MVFTIGYSNRTKEDFVTQIKSRNITVLVDVRSYPRSRNPAFNRNQMEQWCEELGFVYRYEGAVLGGLINVNPSLPSFSMAICRLITWSRSANVAVFCAEGEPENCHRCFDIGADLILRHSETAFNIRRDGSDETMAVSLSRVAAKRFNPLIVGQNVNW